VERTPHPAAAARAALARALLAEESVVGALRGKELGDRSLGLAIGVGHHVGGGRLRLEPSRRPAEPIHQQIAGQPRGPFGQLEVGIQRIARRTTTRTVIPPTTTRTQIRNRKASCSERRGLITQGSEAPRKASLARKKARS